jgi:hypothetical protein
MFRDTYLKSNILIRSRGNQIECFSAGSPILPTLLQKKLEVGKQGEENG